MKITNTWKLIITFVATFAAGAIGSLSTFSQIPTWYLTLNKTVLTPPNWVFGPVWTTLYILMAIAAFLVWKQSKNSKLALTFSGIQLALNALWSILFFGNHFLLGAFIEILFLLASIIATTVLFFRVSRPAGWMMVPYIAWVSFASILNFAVYLANR